jgi:cytochrome c
VVCHSLEKGGPFRVAPNLWGIVDADKGRHSQWYAYSPALIKMGGTWTTEELDEYLADASIFMPGTTKSIRVSDESERREIIEYLQTLKD